MAKTLLATVAAAGQLLVATSQSRESLSLDGSGWILTLDPSHPTTRRLAARGAKTSGGITVPGAWEAQGFGDETVQMKHQYIGAATYSRTVRLPSGFGVGPGRTVWLVVERIQRAASVRAGGSGGGGRGVVVGAHIGYLSPLELDVSEAISQRSLVLSIEVNATRRLDVDGLQGEEDLETDGTGLGGWGGIGGHVRLESRGAGWIVAPHVQHALASSSGGSATVNVTVEVGGQAAGTGFQLRVQYLDAANRTVGGLTADCPDLGRHCGVPNTQLTRPDLWSPGSPQQYTAHLELVDASGEVSAPSTVLTQF
jgi:beta-galactosidase/beta-glucuronidase